MTTAESRALSRAALLVLALCVARALAGHWALGGPDLPHAVPSAAGSLLAASDERRRAEALRARPLAADERLDPNTATEEDLDRLPGVGPATAEGIARVREERGPFSAVADLLTVPGIGPTTLARMRPHLELSVARSLGARAPADRARGKSRSPPTGRGAVDLNRANRRELEELPGVGPALAERILALRDTLGRFRAIDELQRVRGIGPATVARLKPLVFIAG